MRDVIPALVKKEGTRALAPAPLVREMARVLRPSHAHLKRGRRKLNEENLLLCFAF